MKTERRHELQHNNLQDVLAQTASRVQPYTKILVGAVVAILFIVMAYVYTSSQAKEKQRKASEDLFAALSSKLPTPEKNSTEPDGVRRREQLERVSNKYPNTPAGRWARAEAASLSLSMGIDQLYRDREEAKKQIESAVADFKAVQRDAPADSYANQYATFGLARALESQFNIDDAKREYKKLAERPNGLFSQTAQLQIERLNQSTATSWYAWFKEQSPTIPSAKDPGLEGTRPPLDPHQFAPPDVRLRPDSTEAPDSDFPDESTPDATKPDAAKPDAAKPDTTTPGAGANETKPADNTKPANNTKPADTKPAEKKPEPKSDALKSDASKPEAPKSEPTKSDPTKK